MRTLGLGLAMLLSGCTLNVAELQAAQAALDVRLAEAKERADNLLERRRAVEALEAQLAQAQERLSPEQRAALEAVHAPSEPSARAAPVVLPRESLLEGPRAAELRLLLADSQRRLAELEKVLREVAKLDERRREVEAKLAAVGQRQPSTAPR